MSLIDFTACLSMPGIKISHMLDLHCFQGSKYIFHNPQQVHLHQGFKNWNMLVFFYAEIVEMVNTAPSYCTSRLAQPYSFSSLLYYNLIALQPYHLIIQLQASSSMPIEKSIFFYDKSRLRPNERALINNHYLSSNYIGT